MISLYVCYFDKSDSAISLLGLHSPLKTPSFPGCVLHCYSSLCSVDRHPDPWCNIAGSRWRNQVLSYSWSIETFRWPGNVLSIFFSSRFRPIVSVHSKYLGIDLARWLKNKQTITLLMAAVIALHCIVMNTLEMKDLCKNRCVAIQLWVLLKTVFHCISAGSLPNLLTLWTTTVKACSRQFGQFIPGQ